jgi:hypothetical protein
LFLNIPFWSDSIYSFNLLLQNSKNSNDPCTKTTLGFYYISWSHINCLWMISYLFHFYAPAYHLLFGCHKYGKSLNYKTAPINFKLNWMHIYYYFLLKMKNLKWNKKKISTQFSRTTLLNCTNALFNVKF